MIHGCSCIFGSIRLWQKAISATPRQNSTSGLCCPVITCEIEADDKPARYRPSSATVAGASSHSTNELIEVYLKVSLIEASLSLNALDTLYHPVYTLSIENVCSV